MESRRIKIKYEEGKRARRENKGKEYLKKSENTWLKSYVKKVTEKIVETIKKQQDKAHINNTEQKQVKKPKSDIDETTDKWDEKTYWELYIIMIQRYTIKWKL